MSSLGPGLVLRRALSQKLLVIAALGTVVLATTVITALAAYASTVADEGVARRLATASVADVGTRITAPIEDGAAFNSMDSLVRSTATEAYAGTPVTVTATARSASYTAPGQAELDHPELVVFGLMESIEGHATLVEGRWPAESGEDTPVEYAAPASVAAALGLTVGDAVTLRNRLTGRRVGTLLTGVFEPTAGDRYWSVDDLALTGIERLNYTTYGPLVVAPGTFADRFTDNTRLSWFVTPRMPDRPSGALDRFSDALTIFQGRLPGAGPGGTTSVTTGLPALIAQLGKAALVARSTMLIPVLQLAVLAGYAVFVTARLLAEHRRGEIALLRARGATAGHIGTLALREGLMLGVPAAVAAPLLTKPLLRAVEACPTVAASRPTLTGGISPASWVVASVAAALCVGALTVPALRGVSKTYVEARQARGRGERLSVSQRAGLDLALLLIAALGFWQLARYGAPLTATAQQAKTGGLGIDPLIVAAPAIGLVAGGALTLRIVPVVSRRVELVTARRPSFAPALGAWQVSRRPLRYAGPALLLVMAIAVGVLSIGLSLSWRASQQDQADFTAGADLRIRAGTDLGPQVGPLGQGGRYASLPGVTAISPASRAPGTLGAAFGSSTTPVEIVGVDATKLPALLHMRSDLFDGSVDDLARALLPTADRGGIELPGNPARLAVDIQLPANGDAYLRAIVRDATGARIEIPMGGATAGRTTLTADLAALAGPGSRIAYPLALDGFLIRRSTSAENISIEAPFEIVRVTSAAGTER